MGCLGAKPVDRKKYMVCSNERGPPKVDRKKLYRAQPRYAMNHTRARTFHYVVDFKKLKTFLSIIKFFPFFVIQLVYTSIGGRGNLLQRIGETVRGMFTLC